MIIPIRCFTCGKVIANKWKDYNSKVNDGMKRGIALDSVGLTRYCCRQIFLSHVDKIDELILFSDNKNKMFHEKSEKNFKK